MKQFLLLISILVLPMQANSAFIELNSGDFYGTPSGGVGTGRGIGFKAESDFRINSLGIYGDLNERSFRVGIYSSTDGRQANNLLRGNLASRGGNGLGWYDININFKFDKGSYYVFNWYPTISSSTWASSLAYYHDRSLPVTINGLITLIDGVEGHSANNFGNFLHPNLRINTVPTVPSAVPIPASVLLLTPALLGFLRIRYKLKE